MGDEGRDSALNLTEFCTCRILGPAFVNGSSEFKRVWHSSAVTRAPRPNCAEASVLLANPVTVRSESRGDFDV